MGHIQQCRSRSDASDQDPHCLLTESFIKILTKIKKYHPNYPKNENRLVQLNRVGNSIGLNGLSSMMYSVHILSPVASILDWLQFLKQFSSLCHIIYL